MTGKKRLTVGLCAALCMCLTLGCACAQEAELEQMWTAAVEDAVLSHQDEVMELVCLTQDDPQVIWDESGERALLITWHDGEQDVKPGDALKKDEIWATSLGEMENWYGENASGVEDWDLRFAQLLGLPEDCGYTHFTAFWVCPQDVIRPAYVTGVTAQMENDYALVDDAEYKAWFDANIIYSYFESEYPWTRLGYTYDWGGGDSDYGLTEFLVMDAANTQAAFTYSTQEFVGWLEENN